MTDNQDKALALLGIAATKKTVEIACPPENIMSAFIENRVESKTRHMMLSHINHCEECYITWESLSVFLAQHAETVHEAKQQSHTTGSTSVLQKISDWFSSGFSWQIAAPGLALASLAMAVVINMPDTLYTINNPNASVVAAATLDADTLAKNIDQLSLPWESETYGFSHSGYSNAAKAFGAGLWFSRNQLMDAENQLPTALLSNPKINWQSSDYQDYYALGQWSLNAWILARATHVEPKQWERLNQSLESIEVRLQQRVGHESEAKLSLNTIDKLKTTLTRLSKQPGLSEQHNLSREIELGLQRLFI
ncbi:MAG: hypothetical protein K0U68_02195 [Gammaproteobacteria bacterium]|nr:hypothetical protein [Gammaproteobacteria bacterium]